MSQLPVKSLVLMAFVALFGLWGWGRGRAGAEPERSGRGLIALYDFDSPDGTVVKNRAGVGATMDLVISNPKAVRRRSGSLRIVGDTLISTKTPSTHLTEAVQRTREFSLEVWVTPAKANQTGPARIATLSKNGSERNITLGQDGDKFDVRFRTTKTNSNGIPSTSTAAKSLRPKLTHLIYTRDRSGRARIYLDGKMTTEKMVPGTPANWDRSFKLALGNEHSKDRLWLGTYHLIALYNRSLSASEVRQHFQAGPTAGSAIAVSSRDAENITRFEEDIAPLLAKHCLECHDTSSRKGKLDLSRKDTALAGGKHGQAIVANKLDESLLWESIDNDEMPEEGDPLDAQEKALLKTWIESGAHWSLERIDPVNYLHGGGSGPVWIQRLTVTEYIETVRQAVGIDIAKEAREILPRDLRADGFNNTAYNLNVDLKHVSAYARLAELIVERMDLGDFARRFSKSRKFTDKDMGALISAMGMALLRGPLEDHELIGYRGITTAVAAAGGKFEEAVGFVLEALLQSPRFLYRIERQRGDGTSWPVGEYELASRMSYIIWGGPPDQELMRAAADGSLSSPDTLAAQASRMLADPRAVTKSLQFATQWLNLDRLQHLQPDPARFPDWDPQIAADLRLETLTFFEEVAWSDQAPLSALFNAQFSYLTPRLAAHYGLQSQGPGLARYDLSSTPARGGLLTHGSILSIGGDEASMVTRGLFVLHDLLRGVIAAPPPGVDTTPVPSRPGHTQRDAALTRIDDRACGGCHKKFEPLAFGLEKYDGLGRFHERDQFGNKLREDGHILFPGDAKATPFTTSAELMDLLAESGRIRNTLTWKIAQFSLGRPLGAREARTIAVVHRQAQEHGGSYPDILHALVTSDLVLTTLTEFSN